jgi:hypothetical protein
LSKQNDEKGISRLKNSFIIANQENCGNPDPLFPQIPIFALGVGYDTNMDLLKGISHRTPGGVAENCREDAHAISQAPILGLFYTRHPIPPDDTNFVSGETNFVKIEEIQFLSSDRFRVGRPNFVQNSCCV